MLWATLQNGAKSDDEIFGPCIAAAMNDRNCFLDIGGFNEAYFCYLEDVDSFFRLGSRVIGAYILQKRLFIIWAQRYPEEKMETHVFTTAIEI